MRGSRAVWLSKILPAPAPFKTDPTPMRLLALLLAGVVVVALAAVLAAPAANPWSLALTAALLALAALVGGGFLGFLFGIPRSLTSERSTTGNEGATLGRGYLPNSNLEQVSDWLTKILIGVTLVQLGEIPGLVQRLVDYVRGPFGAAPGSTPFILGTLLLYTGGGFLVGYLWSRLYLGRALRLADTESLEDRAVHLQATIDEKRAELASVHAAMSARDKPTS